MPATPVDALGFNPGNWSNHAWPTGQKGKLAYPKKPCPPPEKSDDKERREFSIDNCQLTIQNLQ